MGATRHRSSLSGQSRSGSQRQCTRSRTSSLACRSFFGRFTSSSSLSRCSSRGSGLGRVLEERSTTEGTPIGVIQSVAMMKRKRNSCHSGESGRWHSTQPRFPSGYAATASLTPESCSFTHVSDLVYNQAICIGRTPSDDASTSTWSHSPR